MMKDHNYTTLITWTGNKGTGTSSLKSYERDLTIAVDGKPEIPGTSEVSIEGNKLRYNPEELLQCAVSSCHMLSFLYLCAKNGVIVTAYIDRATGTMRDTPEGSGHFTEIILKPEITIAGIIDEVKLAKLQHEANKICYIANSCNFPVYHQPVYIPAIAKN
jgi:organic hydroperoxide reductase OsmC/OhrA